MRETERTIGSETSVVDILVGSPIISTVIDRVHPVKPKLPIDLETVTPRIARAHPDLIATLTEIARKAGARGQPEKMYQMVVEKGIPVRQYNEKSGKGREATRYYVLRQSAPEIINVLEPLKPPKRKPKPKITIDNVKKRYAQTHPELFQSLGETILDADAHVSSIAATPLLRKAGIKVRVVPNGGEWFRYFIQASDKSRVIALLRNLSITDMTDSTILTQAVPYPSLGSVIRESGIHTTQSKVAELLPSFDIPVRIIQRDSHKRYFVEPKDKQKVIAFLQGLGKELLD